MRTITRATRAVQAPRGRQTRRADIWEALRDELERQVERETPAQFRQLRSSHRALAKYATPAALLAALSVGSPGRDAKGAIYRALVEDTRSKNPTASLARALLWLGLWAGLAAVVRRARRRVLHRSEAATLVAHAFLEEVAGIDLVRCQRVAGTLVRNTYRKVMERLRIDRWIRRWLRVLPPEIAVDGLSPSELGLPPGLPDDDQVDFIRQGLNDLLGPEDARLIVAGIVLGRNLRELGVELDVTHEAVRKRLQRAVRRLREKLAIDDAEGVGALTPSTGAWRIFARGALPAENPSVPWVRVREIVCQPGHRFAGTPPVAGHEEATMPNAASSAVRFSPSTVTREPDRTAHKFILSGRSGIGKTFFASTVPGIFIIPVEEGLKGASPEHKPARYRVLPRSLRELYQAIDAFVEMNAPAADKRRPYTHLAIDSLSGVEALVHRAAQEQEQARHMDAKEYRVVWSAASSFWAEVQGKLDAIHRLGVHVWLIAHASETVEATASGDTFRKWDLMFKGTGASLAEVRQFWRAWADHVFFLDWVAKVVPGSKGKRSVGRYEGRVLHTRESPTYFAKTRARLPASIPAHWDDVARAMAAGAAAPEAKLRAQLSELLPQLEAADRAVIAAELAAATGANRLAILLSRAQGMLALAREDVPEDDEDTQDQAPETSRTGAAPGVMDDDATPAEGTPVDVDDAAAPTDPAPHTIDPASRRSPESSGGRSAEA